MTTQEQIDFILGPQVAIGNSYFDVTQIARGKAHGDACPVTPPMPPGGEPSRANFSSDVEYQTALKAYQATPEYQAWAAAIDAFNMLQYYDLPLCEYVAFARTGDVVFRDYARKCADAWRRHPVWIRDGAERDNDNGKTPPPRHVGLGGLILRALDGRPELWDWNNDYTRANFDKWCKRKLGDPALSYFREAAFSLLHAVWLAAVLPDSFPLQAGGTATNGAALRAAYLADAELVATQYFGRLQQSDGSWRWDDPDYTDADGGQLRGIMQPFMVGLLLRALVDLHRISTNDTVKASIQTQLTAACRHLYSDGPYMTQLVPSLNVKRRGFAYFYHGGTTVNPTKYEKGDYPANWDTTNPSDVQNARQPIGLIVPAFGYCYQLTKNPFFKTAGDELWDSAFGPSDGVHNYMAGDAKSYNQNCRWAGSYQAWAGIVTSPVTNPPDPSPSPSPGPAPAPVPQPAPAPSPIPATSSAIPVITSPSSGATLSGIVDVTATLDPSVAINEAYLVVDDQVVAQGTPLTFRFNTTRLVNGAHSLFVRVWDTAGTPHDSTKLTFSVANAAPTPVPVPSPTPIPNPTPVPAPCSMTVQASVIPPWGSGKLVVSLSGLANEAHTVSAFSDSGQVTVSPATQNFTGTAAVLEFKLQAKKKPANVTVSGPCGTKTIPVKVQ